MIMKVFVSLLIFLCHGVLSFAQADDSHSFLRAKQTMEAEMLQNLSDGMETGQKLVQQSYESDSQGRRLILGSDYICAQIEDSIDEDVDCQCSWQWRSPGFNFKCTSKARVTTLGLTSFRVYTGFVGAVPSSLGGQIKAKVCVTDGNYKGIPLFFDICLDGGLCGGILSLGSGGVCSCKVTYGPATCTCEPCEGGIATRCGPFVLSDICIPLPLA